MQILVLFQKLQFETNDTHNAGMDENIKRRATVIHEYNNKKYPLPLGWESSGTIRMLELVEPLVESSRSSMTIIDELESSLHQDLVESFLRLLRTSCTVCCNGTNVLISFAVSFVFSLIL